MPSDPGSHEDQTGASGTSRSDRRWIPFAVLQAGELGVALSFAVLSVHVHNPVLLLGAAGLVTLLALTADGPLGVVRICGQRLHVHLVAVTAVLIAVAPVLPALRSDIEGIMVTTFGAVGLLRLSTLTASGGRSGGQRVPGGRPVIDATARVSPPVATAGATRLHRLRARRRNRPCTGRGTPPVWPRPPDAVWSSATGPRSRRRSGAACGRPDGRSGAGRRGQRVRPRTGRPDASGADRGRPREQGSHPPNNTSLNRQFVAAVGGGSQLLILVRTPLV